MDSTLSILNPLPVRLDGPELLHELIAGPREDATALEFMDADGKKTCFSYSELHKQAERLASRLVQERRNVSQQTPGIVPVFITQSPSLYISLLAILKSGAAFCPLNLDVPEERLRFILKDTSASVLLTTSDLRSKLPDLGEVSIISVDEESPSSDELVDLSDQSLNCENPLAYIMYTSGSTGLPKAVCLSHLAVTQSLLAHDRHIPSFSRFLQFASPTFDVSVFEIFFPWIRGSTLVSCERGRLLGDLPGSITALNIDAAELTPSVAASLVRTRANVPTLKLLLTIGEMLNAQVIKQFGGSKEQPSILYGMYGPTEAAIHCTLQPEFASDLPAGTIGIPLDTVSCFIVKPAESAERAGDIEIMPLGEIGELAVGGHQLADGYLNRDAQTRAAFVTHPKFGDLYRTGDKARLLPNGTLECHGRISSGQVKLRGQRVELGEIEHAASKVAGCHAVVASVISGLLIVFCIVDFSLVTPKDIKDACKKWLPNYMLPSDVVLLEDFPYLPSGKTDKKKLESDYSARSIESASEQRVLSDDLKKIIEIIRGVLKANIDQSTDLGAAGLDSLKAIQLASEFRRRGYSNVSALELLAAHDLTDVEALVKPRASHDGAESEQRSSLWQRLTDELQSSIQEEPEVQAVKEDIQKVVPCTPLQDAMLSEATRDPQAYCNTLKLSLPKQTSSEQTWALLSVLAEKHAALRSGFWTSARSRSTYAQIIWNSLNPSQFNPVDGFDLDFAIKQDSTLLRPLRFQYKETDACVELLIQIHHALYDQWSIEILLEDLNSLLKQISVPPRPSFEAVNEFYDREGSTSEIRSASMDFWQDYLSGASPGHLPNLSPKVVPVGRLQVAEHTIEVDMDSVRKAATAHSCSPHVFFQAVYAYLLGMYMGTQDVVFGTVFSGRTLPIAGIEDIVGPILSTLPTRINLSDGRRFHDILRRLHGDNRQIMQHSTASLADVRKSCGITPGEALFDSIFVWQETARSSPQDSSLVKLLDAWDYLEFNLTLELEPTSQGVKAKATYQPSTLPLQHVNILLQQLGELVEYVVSEPAAPMENLSDHLSSSLLSIANPHPQFFDYSSGLGAVLEKHASECPEKPALSFASDIRDEGVDVETLSYRELNIRANRLAHFLVSCGVQPDQLVCVCIEKSVDLYVAILASVKTGAGYLPLVPETPEARIRQILAEADVKVCLSDEKTTSIIRNMDICQVVNVTSTDFSTQPETSPVVAFDPANLAYAVFTSGTTGRPKGVLVTQENILSNLQVLASIYPVPDGSRLLQACNQAFDVSVFEIFFTWYTGMCLCSASKDVLFRDFENAINQFEITHLSLTPTVAALANPAHLPSVNFLVTAGEAVTHQVHGAWAGKGLYQGYGPSETTNICTVNPAVNADHLINNIGPGFKNTSTFVLGDGPGFKILPVGSLGELSFGGQQVFRGYQNMPELTQSKIIDHPQYGRIYRSGDLGRLLPDGNILIQGRTDDQRKIRGQRIELGEISSCLLRVPDVQDCVVTIVTDDKQQERLVAFWIPRDHVARDYAILTPQESIRKIIDSLFSHLSDNLPVYMIPDVLVAVSAIPMTGQGKIDKKRLAADILKLSTDDLNFYSQAFSNDTDTTEMSETEKQLVSALADILQMPATSIGRTTSFFALGLDSVSAIRFSTKLRLDFSYRIDVSQILKRPSVARLARELEQSSSKSSLTATNQHSGSSKAVLSPELQNSVVEDFRQHGRAVQYTLPCTPLQEAMLSAGSASETSLAYRNRTLLKLKGDIAKIKSCWELMVQRHGILRTAFSSTEDSKFPFVQIVLSEFTLPWKEGPLDSRDPMTLLQMSSDSGDDLDTKFAPPWEIRVYQSGSDAYLVLDMHHALYDANAMSNLLRDVEQHYEGRNLAEPSDFTSFLDYMLSVDLDEADKFFTNQLHNYIPKPLPSNPSKHAGQGYGCITAAILVSQQIVEEFLKRHSLTMLSLTQAVWAKVLSTAQSYSDVCFGNVVSGRSVPVEGVESLVAPCFNTIPVRMDLSKHRTNLALMKALQKTNFDALPYQLTPLRRIQGRSTVKGHRLFDSLVLLQQDSTDVNPDIWTLEGETGEMNFPCIVEFAPACDTFSVSLHFDRTHFDEDAVSRLQHACLSAFASCIRYPSSDVSDLVDFDNNSINGSLKPDQQLMESIKAAAQPADDQPVPEDAWTPVELQIRAAYSAISSIPETQISKNTTIYRIGLDSISAIQIASQLRKKGFPLQASDVMESPSCSELASAIQSRSHTPAKSTPAFDLESFDKLHRQTVVKSYGVPADQIAAVRPCTAVQSGMLSQYLHSGFQQYLNHTFYSLDLDIDLAMCKWGWSQVVAKHEMLRTGFVSTDDNEIPFVMVTYRDWDVSKACLEAPSARPSTFASSEQAALKSVQDKLHSPPWRWSLLKIDGKLCLQFSAHHALFDAETLRVLMSDLRSALNGETLQIREPIDSALSLIVTSSQSDRDGQQSFWSRQLENAAVTRFPNMSPIRVSEQGTVVIQRTFRTTRQDFEMHCRRAGVSMQAVGQAAWARILSSYTGETHVSFGVVFSGRTTPETADAPFPCITTLPVSSDTSVADGQLLQDLMSYNAGIQKYQFTPLTAIQKYAGLPNEPLFDTLFAYQRPLGDDTTHVPWNIVRETASVDLAVSLEMESLPNNQLGLRLTVDPGQIPKAQGEIMLHQMEEIFSQLVGITDSLDTSCLAVLPPKDPILPSDVQYLHGLVEASVQRWPDRIALEFVTSLEGDGVTSRKWTYLQLDEEANRVAQLLAARGVKPGGVVATSFDKCPEASFAFLGILKAGCAFCAIDPTAPAARKTFILQDSKASVMLTTASIRADVQGVSECEVIDLVNLEGKKSLSTAPLTISEISPASVSYVLYTSGTTGTPKGCELTHENAVQALLAFQRLFEGRWTEDSRWLQFASYHFDVAVLEQFWSWSTGIRLVCAPRDLVLEDIMGFLDTMQITHLDLTPSLGRLLEPSLVPSLHQGVFITGGEALKQDMIDSWGEVGCLYNFYGPTECTIGVTTFPCVPKEGKPSNIGWQFDNVGSYVLAPGSHQPVLRGAIGELCISGKLVGKGYLNRPELTDDRFPYLKAFDERVYRTGDLVRVLYDGSFDFLGRQDNQVKLRGQRLEIDEIEAVIRRCPEIQDTVCLVAKHPKQQKDLLVGFIALSSNRQQGKPDLCPADSTKELIQMAQTACEEHLPGYMVPTHFLPIQHIPLSVNNKVEEKVLRQLYADMSTSAVQAYAMQSQSQQPLNETEKPIAQQLSDLLKINLEELQPTSNVFTLGLNSISAMQFSRKLKTAGFPDASVAAVLKNSTIQKLAKALSTSSREANGEITAAKQTILACRQRYMGTATRTFGCSVDDIEIVAPCTPLQQGIISRSLASESSLYFNSFLYTVHNADLGRLQHAFEEALSRTQILRAAFIETDDGYVQAVRKTGCLLWSNIEVATETAIDEIIAKRRVEWQSSNSTHLTTPFEVLAVLSPSQTVLVIHIHHALYDGNSFELLISNVLKVYDSQPADFGKPFIDALPFGPLRSVDGAKEFWTGHLSGANSASVPSLVDRAAERDTLFATSLDILGQADQMRRSLGVTLQALIQTCWMTTLRKYYDGAVGTVVSGRSIDFDGVETVIGPLFNTIPFRPEFDGEDSWEALVQRCHDFNTSALPYQHTPLRDIMKWCKKGRSEPLFDTLFVFQSELEDSSTESSILVAREDSRFEADYPLSFEAEETSGGKLNITIAAKASICNEIKAQELVKEFSDAFSAMIREPGASIGSSVGHEFVKSTRTAEPEVQTNGFHNFEWTPEAVVLQNEIASLAAVDSTDIDERTSIFEVGLDSVDAVKLSSRLKKKGLLLAVSSIMKSSTISKMVAAFANAKPDASSSQSGSAFSDLETKLASIAKSSVDIGHDVERILPTSPMQEALVSEMITSSYHAYFNHDVLKIPSGVDVERLEQAWGTVIEASPILRTGFLQIMDPDVDATFAQVIHKYRSFSFSSVELSSEEDITSYLDEISGSVAQAPLSLPQLRLTIANTPAGRFLIFSIAHALYDGHSLTLLHEDVYRAYADRYTPRPFYGEVLQDAVQASNNEATAFWRSLLSGASRTHLPRVADAFNDERIVTHRRETESPISAHEVSVFGKKHGVTMQAICQTAWAMVLAHSTRALDVLFGVVLAGRDSELAEQVMFPMMNTVVMRSIVHGSRKDMLQSIQSTIADLTNYQHFPLRQIQAACQKEVSGDDSENSLFEALFTYQRRPAGDDNETAVLYESVNGASEVEYPVAVEAEVVDDTLVWRVACKSNAFSVEDANQLLNNIHHVLNEIIYKPDESSLAFQDQAVSICGLPSFKRVDDSPAEANLPLSEEPTRDVETWSSTETTVREVIARVTKTPEDDISKTVAIQNLGVDSINAIKISGLLRGKAIKIAVSDIIKAGSIAKIASAIGEKNAEDPQLKAKSSEQSLANFIVHKGFTAEQFGYDTKAVERILPATAGQVYMLSAWQATNGQIFFPEFEYQIKTSVTVDVIRQAWQKLVSNNPLLRTVFTATQDLDVPFLQLVLRDPPASFFDLQTHDLDFTHKQQQPLVRLAVAQSDQGYQVSLKIHHVLYDAVSLPVLMQTLGSYIESTTAPSSQFTFDAFVAHNVASTTLEKRKEFWTKYLQGAHCSKSLPSSESTSVRHIETFDPQAMSTDGQSEAALRKQGLSLQAVFFAAYAKAYVNLTGKDSQDAVVGIYLANRSHTVDLQSLAAPTLNLVPLRVRSPKNTSIAVLAKQIQNDLQDIGDAENSTVGLWEIERWTGIKVDTFVNFIKLPDSSDESDTNTVIVSDESADSRRVEKRSVVFDAAGSDFEAPLELQHKSVTDTYVRSLDIEATVANGALGVGVFGWEDMINIEEAEKLRDDIVREIRGVVE